MLYLLEILLIIKFINLLIALSFLRVVLEFLDYLRGLMIFSVFLG